MMALALIAACSGTIYAEAKAKEGGEEAQQVIPKKVAVDTVGDGKPHRFEYYDEKGIITKVEFDKVGDGIIDEAIEYKDGKPYKSWKDTKRKGKPDVWIEYQ
jgi:hypothetical protein